MRLADTITDLAATPNSLCIVARRPWSPAAEAKLIAFTEACRVPDDVLADGYEYFLEVSVAREEVIGALQGLSDEQLSGRVHLLC